MVSYSDSSGGVAAHELEIARLLVLVIAIAEIAAQSESETQFLIRYVVGDATTRLKRFNVAPAQSQLVSSTVVLNLNRTTRFRSSGRTTDNGSRPAPIESSGGPPFALGITSQGFHPNGRQIRHFENVQ